LLSTEDSIMVNVLLSTENSISQWFVCYLLNIA
jgi:hypothetical protein